MFGAKVDINRKDYMSCNAYYLKKFLGLKEYILLAVLVIGGLVLYFAFNQLFILILCGVTIVIVAAALIIYRAVASKSYKEEYEKRNTHEWIFSFDAEGFSIEVKEENGEKSFTERRTFEQVEKAAVLKDRVYLYTGAATMYYIKYDSMTEGGFQDFCDFIKAKVAPDKFKMKAKRKQFPYGR